MNPEWRFPSPIQQLTIPVFEKQGIELWIKREDQIHPFISGNKWRKLKYNLSRAKQLGKTTLLTFGGAYSNHLYATAAAAEEFGFSSIGLVRGEPTEILNPTLRFVREKGMQLYYLTRADYRQKETVIAKMGLDRKEIFILPEGGSNEWAIPGCAEIGKEISTQFPALPDYICICCGTGGTAAGLICGMKGAAEVLAFSVLKGDFHQPIIEEFIKAYQIKTQESSLAKLQNWKVNTDYHFGGYARFDSELIDFINRYKDTYDLPLDPIYTGKMFFALEDLAHKQYFKKGTKILAIHTGGLQGIAGFNQRFDNLIKVT